MILTLTGVAAAAVLWNAERATAHLALALAAFGFIAAALLLATGDLERALLLTVVITAAIHGASCLKYTHSGLKLTVTDLPLLAAGTVPFFFVQYPLAVAAAITGTIGLLGVAVAAVLYLPGTPLPLLARLVLFGLAALGLGLAYRLSSGAAALQAILAQPRCFFSTFVASLLDPRSWRRFRGFVLADIADDPLPLLPATPARRAACPDIIVIQHESIFDPRLYGLPVGPLVEGLLSPPHGVHGRLNVDIFGGGSWQSEFSLLTGLSSASFGSNGYFLFERGAGCFHHSLPEALAALGYATTLTSSCRRDFLNYENFYRAIGMRRRIFTDDFPPPFSADRFEATHSDADFLTTALDLHAEALERDARPRFLYLLTNYNHGPHSRRLVAAGRFERERAFAMASLPDPAYAEYYARLVETAATWQKLRADIRARAGRRPTLVVHYGDHQPVMTRRIEAKLKLPRDARRQFRTFYAIEMLNDDALAPAAGRGPDLDIAFLGTLALQHAGLPLDPVFSTRASLMEQCGDGYFAARSERKRRFHRTLVDLGLIDLAHS
ncbi:MAG: sulfatase-like hydrolase/transferase [Xanthobacteraceae bacterium]